MAKKTIRLKLESLNVLDTLSEAQGGELFRCIRDYYLGKAIAPSQMVAVAMAQFSIVLDEQRNLLDDENVKREQVPYQKIVDLYHEILPELTTCKELTPKRKDNIKKIWLEQMPDLGNWRNFFAHVRGSDFLMGKVSSVGRRPLKTDIEWLTNYTKFINILERKYD